MNNPLQEELLGYVLGALDAQEQRDLEHRIDQDPELEEQLLQLRSSLLPLDFIESAGSCPGLARRTLESVAIWQNSDPIGRPDRATGFVDDDSSDDGSSDDGSSDDGSSDDGSIRVPTFRSAIPANGSELAQSDSEIEATDRPRKFGADRVLHLSTWSVPDVLVGVALLAIIAGILFPAISITRANSRLAGCQNNLQQLAVSLLTYSAINDGKFVEIPSDGPLSVSGCFAPTLKDANLLGDDSMLACAGLGARQTPVFVPTRKQVLEADDEALLLHYHRTMAGDFGYAFGYLSNGRYHSPQNKGRSNMVLVSDQPSVNLAGRQSTNHNGWGQNCVFEDGHVALIAGHSIGSDALFLNDYGLVAPGANFQDNVIAPSYLSPTPMFEVSIRSNPILE